MKQQLTLVLASAAYASALCGVPFVSLSYAAGGDTTKTAHVCIVLPSVAGVEGSATEVGVSLRQLFESYLTGPSLQAVALESRLASQAVLEARQRGCGNLLRVALQLKRGGGGGGLFGKVLGQAGSVTAWSIPGGSVEAAIARGATIAASQAVGELASGTRTRDEMRLEWSLATLDGGTLAGPQREQAKAKTDGEDLLTPLVERAAESIAAAVIGR
jgi:hypothetical protein